LVNLPALVALSAVFATEAVPAEYGTKAKLVPVITPAPALLAAVLSIT